jgi:hypothetical protein
LPADTGLGAWVSTAHSSRAALRAASSGTIGLPAAVHVPSWYQYLVHPVSVVIPAPDDAIAPAYQCHGAAEAARAEMI